jgi:hypothetical protein
MKRSSFLKALIAIPFGVSLVKNKEKSPYNGNIKLDEVGLWPQHGSPPYWKQMAATRNADVRLHPYTPEECIKLFNNTPWEFC